MGSYRLKVVEPKDGLIRTRDRKTVPEKLTVLTVAHSLDENGIVSRALTALVHSIAGRDKYGGCSGSLRGSPHEFPVYRTTSASDDETRSFLCPIRSPNFAAMQRHRGNRQVAGPSSLPGAQWRNLDFRGRMLIRLTATDRFDGVGQLVHMWHKRINQGSPPNFMFGVLNPPITRSGHRLNGILRVHRLPCVPENPTRRPKIRR